jgi:hypothetical protein
MMARLLIPKESLHRIGDFAAGFMTPSMIPGFRELLYVPLSESS